MADAISKLSSEPRVFSNTSSTQQTLAWVVTVVALGCLAFGLLNYTHCLSILSSRQALILTACGAFATTLSISYLFYSQCQSIPETRQTSKRPKETPTAESFSHTTRYSSARSSSYTTSSVFSSWFGQNDDDVLDFYEGQRLDDQEHSIEYILFNYSTLPYSTHLDSPAIHHDIAWLFPTTDRDRRSKAPYLNVDLIFRVRASQAIQNHMRQSFYTIMLVYGFHFSTTQGESVLGFDNDSLYDSTPKWMQAECNGNPNDHLINMYRILRSLHLFGLESQRSQLYNLLKSSVPDKVYRSGPHQGRSTHHCLDEAYYFCFDFSSHA